MAIKSEHISTGQAAQLCSVTPDTVLKWVKSGRISANRTAGGHYRISRSAILTYLESGEFQQAQTPRSHPFQFCWEYNSTQGEVKDGCLTCIAYRSRALRCYEMRELPSDAGYNGLYCKGTCTECEYYRIVNGQRPNVLILTGNLDLKSRLEKDSKSVSYNLSFADSEYQCAMVVEAFRPDFVVVDCAGSNFQCDQLVRNLTTDPRIPYIRIIVSGKRTELSKECDKKIFAQIEDSFGASDLSDLLAGCRGIC